MRIAIAGKIALAGCCSHNYRAFLAGQSEVFNASSKRAHVRAFIYRTLTAMPLAHSNAPSRSRSLTHYPIRGEIWAGDAARNRLALSTRERERRRTGATSHVVSPVFCHRRFP